MQINQVIIENLKKQFKRKTELPEGKKLLLYLNNMLLITGRVDVMFCNSFVQESLQLLVNSILLYEDGFFDCAFYSLRQASEVIDTMLYLANADCVELKKWEKKERFPMDSKIREQLKNVDMGYEEISILLKDYFEHHRELIKKTHKIIHKQGLDTFYAMRLGNKAHFEQEETLFVETLKYTIGIEIIVFVLLDPISLVMADEELTMKFHHNPLTEAIDTDYFEKYLGLTDIIEKIKSSNFYRDFSEQFELNEEMNMATCSVIRDNAWDIKSLNDIEKQIHLLNSYEKYMFRILKAGIRITNFYYMGGWDWYFTTYKSKYPNNSFSSESLVPYKEKTGNYNQKFGEKYISTISMYDDALMMEHDEQLSESEIERVRQIESEEKKEYVKLQKESKNEYEK